VLIGLALTCVVHGDQRDVGGRAPAQESVADQRRMRALPPDAGERAR
jgi:hypothetical protein